jgi:hypothetical protein
MTVTALPGNIRFRALQLGVETTFGTQVAATRRMPWRFNPTVDPHWTTPDVDTGTLDPALSPYRTGIDVTGQTTGPLAYNDAQILWAALLKGGVAPSGGGNDKTWQFSPASTSADPFEIFTAEWGDEVAADQWRYLDGVLNQLQLEWPQDLGPVMHTGDWRFASATYPSALTGALSVPTAPNWVYGADTTLYINDNAGAMGITPLANSMHGNSLTIQNNLDVKRFSNGSNTNFAVAGYGRGARTLESTFTLAKSAIALAEVVKWLNASPLERFVSLDTVSRETIPVALVPYSHRLRFAGYWFTRQETAIGSNSGVQLVCRHIYDPALVAPIDVRIVNRMGTLAPASP